MAGAREIYVTAYFIPLSTVAKWPTPLGDKAITRHWYVPFIIVLTLISTISIVVRFYAQYTKRIRKTGIDDLFILLAWVRLCLSFQPVGNHIAHMHTGVRFGIHDNNSVGNSSCWIRQAHLGEYSNS
jgi:hypothetical protein